jgi:ribose transport system permease protein
MVRMKNQFPDAAESVPFVPKKPALSRRRIVFLSFIFLFIVLATVLRNRGFLDPENLINILRQTAIISIMSVAMTFVIVTGEIDLSVGAVAGLASVVTALVIQDAGVVAGIVAGISSGMVFGLANGILTTRLGIPSFLATLAMTGVARGCGMWLSHTASIPVFSNFYVQVFGGGTWGPMPVLLLWTIAFGLVGHVILNKAPFGRQALATGGHRKAASYSGIDTTRIRTSVMVISGATAAVAGMLYAGRLQSGRSQLGEGDELSVIAAAVLGGTSLFGGRGTVVGSVAGALVIGIVNDALTLLGLNYSQQLIARGVIIILAVAISNPDRE